MQQSNNKKEEVRFENPVFDKIIKIIKSKITAGEIQTLEKKLGFKKTILKIIEKDKGNKQLANFLISEISPSYFISLNEFHNDLNIASLAIMKDSSMFLYTSKKLKSKIETGVIVLESMLREGKNFFEINNFIEKYYEIDKDKLFKRYREFLELGEYIYSGDITKQVLLLKDSNKILYDFVINSGLIGKTGKKIDINKDFVNNIINNIRQDNVYLNLEQTKQLDYKKNLIENMFGIKFSSLNIDERFVFDSLLELININESKQKLSEKNNTEKEKNTQTDEIKGNQNLTEKTVIQRDDFEDLLQYTYPQSHFYVSEGGYNIETFNGKKVFITNKEKDKFTSKALSNYIKFYNTLYNLGIIFLWEKYKNDFNILCNNKFGFDYINSEGITETKILSVLNMIAKNIGIPEKIFLIDTYNENGELQDSKKQDKKIGCFNTLGDAKLAFIEIKETGNINGESYSDNSAFGNGAIENKLIEVLCIDQKGNGLNISKWK